MTNGNNINNEDQEKKQSYGMVCHDMVKQPASELDDLHIELKKLRQLKTRQKNLKEALKREIAKRRQIERELTTTRIRLKFIVDNNPAVIYSSEAFGNYRATYVSDNVTAMTGFPPQSFIEIPDLFLGRIHPEDLPVVYDKISRLHEKGECIIEFRFLHKDGSYRWTQDSIKLVRDEKNQPLEHIGCWIDIHHRKMKELELCNSEERFSKLFNLNPVMNSLISLNDNRYIDVNESFLKATGYEKDEVLGRTPEDIGLYPNLPGSAVIKNTAGEQTVNDIEVQYKTKKGDIRTGIQSCQIITINRERCLLTVIRDITDLKKREFQLQTLFNLSVDMIIINKIGGHFTHANPAVEKILGYSEEEFKQLRPVDIIHPDELKVMLAERDRIISDNTCANRFRNRYRCKDGSYRWIELNSVPVQEEGLFYSVARDVTETILAHEKLLESERLFRTSVENMLDCFGIYSAIRDENGKITDFKIEYVNQLACDNNSLKREDQIGKRVLELFPGHMETGLFIDYCNVVETGRPLIKESIFYEDPRNKKIVVAYDIRAAKTSDGFIACWRNITEKKHMENELVNTNKRFSSIIESISDGFFALDKEFCFVFSNKTFEEIIKKPAVNLIGKNIWAVFPESVGTGFYNELSTAMSEQKTTSFDMVGIYSGRQFEIHAYPFQEGLSVFFRDVTERKLFEKELSRLDRLNLVGQMAAGIGHEIRNPMTSVRGFLQLLADKDEYSRHSDYFKLMIAELDRANSIITEYLSVAKDKPVSLSENNLNSVLESLQPLIMATAMNFNINVSLDLENTPNIPLNESEIRQLILNLVQNGLEAMTGGNVLTIRTFVQGDEVLLSVTDRGNGIPVELQDKIGLPFFTTKENGTGLGLAVCYGIAARHNARIDYKTGESGTAFFVRFARS